MNREQVFAVLEHLKTHGTSNTMVRLPGEENSVWLSTVHYAAVLEWVKKQEERLVNLAIVVADRNSQ